MDEVPEDAHEMGNLFIPVRSMTVNCSLMGYDLWEFYRTKRFEFFHILTL